MVDSGRKNISENNYYDSENKYWLTREIADEVENRLELKYISTSEDGKLYVYQYGIWTKRGESKVRKEVLDITNELIRKTDRNQIQEILETRNEVYREDFQHKRNLIPFKNGVYDVKKDEFRDFKPEDNLTFKFNVPYKDGYSLKELRDNKVNDFLKTIQDTDEKIKKLKEAAGLAMLPEYPIDKALLLQGKGGNGKNMYVKILRRIIGDGYHKINSKQLVTDKFAKKELEDTFALFLDEFGKIADVDQIKTFIGSDEMRVRPFHGEGYMVEKKFFPIFAANELPKPPEQNAAFFRRWEVIDFPYQFTDDPEDEHKDKVSKDKLKEKYMNEEALSLFASECINHLRDFLDQGGFTEGYSAEETREIWNNKASPVYSFFNKFVEQGSLPEQGSKDKADKIAKKDMKELVNSYSDMFEGRKYRTHDITNAINGSADLEKGKDGKIELEDGKHTNAYTGLKVSLPNYRDYQESDKLYRFTIQNLGLLSKYTDEDVLTYTTTTRIEVTAAEFKAMKYLKSLQGKSCSRVKLTTALKLSEKELKNIIESEYIYESQNRKDQLGNPYLVLNEEKFSEALENCEALTGDIESVDCIGLWLERQIESWSKHTEKKIPHLVEKGVEQGFGENAMKNIIDRYVEEDKLIKTEPDKVSAN